MGGWIVFDGKSGRLCPGSPLFLSLVQYWKKPDKTKNSKNSPLDIEI